MPERNTELLERVMQHIDDHPELHDQATWCGTAQCFAGWATQLSGNYKLVGRLGGLWMDAAGCPYATSDAAITALGLTEDEADVLFDACNSRDALRLMVKDLVNGDTIHSDFDYEAESRG